MSEPTIRHLKWTCVGLLLAYFGYAQSFPNAQWTLSDNAQVSLIFLTLSLVLLHGSQKAMGLRLRPLRMAAVVVFGLGAIFFAALLGVQAFGGGHAL